MRDSMMISWQRDGRGRRSPPRTRPLLAAMRPLVAIVALSACGAERSESQAESMTNARRRRSSAADQPPVAIADPDETRAYEPLTGAVPLSLDPRTSFDPDGTLSACTVSYYTNGSYGSSCRVVYGNERAFAPGSYSIRLTVTDDAGLSASTTKHVTVVAAGRTPPTDGSSRLDAGPDLIVRAGEEAVFDFSGSWLAHGHRAGQWSCDFGDGATGDCGATYLANKHAYAGPGTYVATFSVDFYSTPPTTDTVTVTVLPSGDAPPVAVADADQTLSYDPSVGSAPLSIDPRGSFDPDGTLTACSVSYYSNGSAGSSCHVVYSNERAFVPGIYPIQLTVTDDAGSSASTTKTVTLVAPGRAPPSDGSSRLDAGPDLIVHAGEPAVFDFSGTWLAHGYDAGQWSCSFGDGASQDGGCGATLLVNRHIYSNPGTYVAKFSLEFYGSPSPSDDVVVSVLP
jgi:PKD repeat protein